jgi:hypothetical protein
MGMTSFFRRFVGALVLDAGAFEEIEASPVARMQAVLVVLLACASAGLAAVGLGSSPISIAATVIMALGAWVIWVTVISTVGTIALREPDTRSNVREVLTTMGFAAAPGVFVAFAGIRPAMPLVLTLVSAWMVAAAVVAVRQALDYHSTARAAVVCALAWLLSVGVVAAISMVFTTSVS